MFSRNPNHAVQCVFSDNKIRITARITITAPATDVFSFVSNFENDPLWRSEIIKSEASLDISTKSTMIREHSRLSKKEPNHLLVYTIVHLDPLREIIAETQPSADFQVKSKRSVIASSDSTTEFDYEVTFDESAIPFAKGHSVPRFILQPYLKNVTKGYLKKLKKTIEANSTQAHR